MRIGTFTNPGGRQVAQRMVDDGTTRVRSQGERMLACALRLHREEPEASTERYGRACRHRLCPGCAAAKCRDFLGRILEKTSLPANKAGAFSLVTLTQPLDLAEDPRQAFERAARAWTKLRMQRTFRELRGGWLKRVEVKRGRLGGWHAHVHVVFESPHVDIDRLREDWLTATGADVALVDAERIAPGEEAQTMSYLLKVQRLPLADTASYAEALHGVRDVSLGGAWYGRKR